MSLVDANIVAAEKRPSCGGGISGPVHIALASDQRYFPGLLVTASSMALYANANAELCFHILNGGVSQECCDRLEKCVRRVHAKSSFDYIRVNIELFANLRAYHGSLMTYARILLPELLATVDALIYCDVDFLWMADVAELWNLRDSNLICQGCHDPIMTETVEEIRWLRSHGFAVEAGKYICAGLELLNLRLMRQENIANKMLKFLQDNPDNPQNDQTAINAIAVGRIGILEDRWMCYSFLIGHENPVGKVLHYATYGEVLFGLKKPSKRFVVDDAVLLWHRFAAYVSNETLFVHLSKVYDGFWGYGLRRIPFLLSGIPIIRRFFAKTLSVFGFSCYARQVVKVRPRFRQPFLGQLT